LITPLGKTESSHASQESTRGTLRIAETFTSRQGEGSLTGVESFFIRTSGCNLRCWFCDTPYASWNARGSHLSIDALLDEVARSECEHVVLTGGEPLLSPQVVPLCQALRRRGLHLTIETAGTVDQPVECDLMSISPKFASSTPAAEQHPKWSNLHERRRMSIDTIVRLIGRAIDYQLKFVVDSAKDFDELTWVANQLAASPGKIWIMPQGSTPEALDSAALWLKPWCEKNGFHYCDRMQIRWYGNRRGT
jgi:7-carboxy-7-deazaguanine synthase